MSGFTNFLKDSGNISRILAATFAAGGIVFHMGKLTQKVDDILPKVETMGIEQNTVREAVYDMHGKVCRTEQKIDTIENDVRYIREKITGIK